MFFRVYYQPDNENEPNEGDQVDKLANALVVSRFITEMNNIFGKEYNKGGPTVEHLFDTIFFLILGDTFLIIRYSNYLRADFDRF